MSGCQDSWFSEGGTNQVTEEKYVSIYGESPHSASTSVLHVYMQVFMRKIHKHICIPPCGSQGAVILDRVSH